MNHIQKEEFDDIFRYEIQNNGKHKKIGRDKFWKRLYIERKDEKDIFESFINSGVSILFLTGYVGSGKSTFIRSMYEKHSLCNGIVIDFQAHAKRFKSGNQDIIENTIDKVLKESLLNLIRENIKYNLINEIEEYEDYHYNPEKKLVKIDTKIWNNAYWDHQTNIELLKYCLTYLYSDLDISSLASSLAIVPTKVNEDFGKICRTKIEKKPEILEEFYKLLDWEKLIELLRKLLDNGKPFVLTFDNIDALKFNKIHNHFLDYLINIANATNNKKSDGKIAMLNPTPIRVVINVRDENISRLNLSSAGTERSLQLMLHEKSYLLTAARDRKSVDKERKFFFDIVTERLKLIGEEYNYDDFKIVENLINTHIIDSSSSTLKNGEEYLNIKNVSNESIRMMLDLISDLAFHLLDSINDENKEMVKVDTLILKGKMIAFLWKYDSTKKVFKSVAKSIEKEKKGKSGCCSYRMTLTKLYNDPNNEVSFGELQDSLLEELNIQPEKTRKTIFELFNSGNRESEIITIYQNKLINNKTDLKKTGKIKLNLKGKNFLLYYMKHLDFFGRITESIHNYGSRTLFELMPDEAVNYCNTIFNYINDIFTNHDTILKNEVFPHFNKLGNPFERFSEHYCIGKGLFLERLCTAHINLIKRYITEILKGQNASLLIATDQIQTLDKYLTDESNYNKSDYTLIKKIKESDEQVLADLFQIVSKYENLSSDITKLKRYTPANNI